MFSSPAQIIRQFQDGRYTQALALVVSWGTMWRTSGSIWGRRPPELIEGVLRNCATSIQKSNSIATAWQMLAGREEAQLGWSDVLTSKTLHFLCRSLGFERNAPVPIDGKIIVQRVWPEFRRHSRELRPEKWHATDNGFEAYNRYMTAIRSWADQLQWTTTQTEQTIYLMFYPEIGAVAGPTSPLEVAQLSPGPTRPTPPAVRANQRGEIVTSG